MLDIVMIALLFIGFVSMKLLADWCGKQTEKNNVMYGGITYVVLAVVIIMLIIYLVYALINPEKF
ncbi:K(+)-transporting ATPase subunit F [Clostridioides difficile]|nr:K(+)-transporting ATPase subunit F [Clostridioides difficile]